MIQSHLNIFAKHNNGDYPDRILIFRDGISEGQYAPVLTYETDKVKRACEKIKSGYRPKILICACAKRHSTRFFGDSIDIDTSGNLHSGLVVDQGITHPYAFDFFMQSHQGRVGTARPTHYVCLLDEIGVSPDELQKMVHSLCFTFARCTKSVSIVPVCYIAGKSQLMVQLRSIADTQTWYVRKRGSLSMNQTSPIPPRRKVLTEEPILLNPSSDEQVENWTSCKSRGFWKRMQNWSWS
jgi:eukaryotic translation initiation factor 2C